MADKQSKLEPSRSETETASATARPVQTGSEAIRSDIEQTRTAMDLTLERLNQRLKPRHLLDDLFDFFQREPDEDEGSSRRTMREAGETALAKLKQHPVPATMIGAGLAWLLVDDRNGTQRRGSLRRRDTGSFYTGTAGDAAEDGYLGDWSAESDPALLDKANEKLSGLKHSVGDAASKTKNAAHQVRGQVQEGLSTGKDRISRVVNEAPLAIGVAALAAGLLAGLLLPSTRMEDELLGEASDGLKGRARAAKEKAKDQTQDIAAGIASAAQEEELDEIAPDVSSQSSDYMEADASSARPREVRRQINGGTAYFGGKIDRL